MKTFRPKQPKHGSRISFARVVAREAVTWRLYRRSEIDRRLFVEAKSFSVWEHRTNIAAHLRQMRRRILDAVDAYDLSRMGETV